MSVAATLFYFTGGSLPGKAPSYMERQADAELLTALGKGEFCHVLASRQTGKSSLLLRTAQKLREQGITVIALDLSAIGPAPTPEQWYESLAARIGYQLKLEEELRDFWRENVRLSPAQRLFAALRKVALPALKKRANESAVGNGNRKGFSGSPSARPPSTAKLVVLLDDIDMVRHLPFTADDFFAGIRECYIRRSEDPEFNRLAFGIFGATNPSDLLSDARATPFNIGRRIALKDFTFEEGAGLAAGLKVQVAAPEGQDAAAATQFKLKIQDVNSEEILLKRIFYWTHGHPYLTQRLCKALADALAQPVPGQSSIATRDFVDQLCEELFLSSRAREGDENLLFVRESLLHGIVDQAGLLDFYLQVRNPNKRVAHDETNPFITVLCLSGIVTVDKGFLRVRNRIYESTFDQRWVKANMPAPERRRQQAAYNRGVLRASTVGALLLAVVGALAYIAFQQSRVARDEAGRFGRMAKEDRARLVQLNAVNGLRLMEQNRLMSSLPWFAEALRLADNDPGAEEMHRYRLNLLLRHCPRLVQIYTHTEGILHVEFSSDGRRIVTTSADRTARIWDATSGEPVTAPLRHEAPVVHASFSPDDQRVVTAGADGTVRLWNAVTGEPIVKPLLHPKGVVRAVFSPAGDQILTAGADGAARIWNATSGELVTPPLPHDGAILDVAFSPDGRLVATASSGNAARVWNAASGQPVTPLLAHAGIVTSISFSPDGTRVLTSSHDGTARIWNATNGTPTVPPLKQAGGITRAVFSPDGRFIVTAGLDRTARLWSALTGEPMTPPLPHTQAVGRAEFSPDGRAVLTFSSTQVQLWDAITGAPTIPALEHNADVATAAFSPDGSRVVTACVDGTVRLWNIAIAASDHPLLFHRSAVHHAAVSPDGQTVVTASGDGIVQLWDAISGLPAGPPLVHFGHVYQAFFHPEGKLLVTACEDGAARLWDLEKGERRVPPLRHDAAVHHAAFSANGRLVVTAGFDRTARVWDVATGHPLVAPFESDGSVVDAAFSPDGTEIVTTSSDGTVQIWNLRTGRMKGAPFRQSGPVSRASFSPDGRRIVIASGREARVWDVETRQAVGPALQHANEITDVSFSPDNQRVVTGSRDGTARVWNAATGQPVTPILQHGERITHAAFSPDGLRVATAGWNGTTLVWDVFTGQPVAPPFRHGAAIVSMSFSPDGRRLVTASYDQTARVWSLPAEDRPAADLEVLASLVSGYRIDRAGLVVPLEQASLLTNMANLKAKYPADFEFNQNQVLAWHRHEAEQSERRGMWFSAAFHLAYLTAALPNDPDLRQRQAAAQTELNKLEQSGQGTESTRPLPVRVSRNVAGLIDLSAYGNDSLAPDNWRSLLAHLPRGQQVLAGIDFDTRGVIVLAGAAVPNGKLPTRVNGIPINRSCQRLHFLHASGDTGKLAEGTPVGSYVVHYAGGLQQEIPIRYGLEVRDWLAMPNTLLELKNGVTAWTGTYPAAQEQGGFLRLFKNSWVNSNPNLAIESIDFVSALSGASPVLMAITVEP
jgi:WD40 repeat protein